MRTSLAIALGGAVGSLARYWIGVAMLGVSTAFPLGTLVINVAGSFVLGALLGAWPASPSAVRAGLAVGVCGGFTTFSTFSAEVVALAERGAAGRAAAYAGLSVGLSVAAMLVGLLAGRAVVR